MRCCWIWWEFGDDWVSMLGLVSRRLPSVLVMPGQTHHRPITEDLLLIIIIQFVRLINICFTSVFVQWSQVWLQLVINQLLNNQQIITFYFNPIQVTELLSHFNVVLVERELFYRLEPILLVQGLLSCLTSVDDLDWGIFDLCWLQQVWRREVSVRDHNCLRIILQPSLILSSSAVTGRWRNGNWTFPSVLTLIGV